MTDLYGTDARPALAGSSETIPGQAVRDLVAWREQQIEALLRELDEALWEAEEAERRLAEQPATAFLDGHPGGGGSNRSGPPELTSAPAPAPALPAPPPALPAPAPALPAESWPLDAPSASPPMAVSELPTAPLGIPVVTAARAPRTTVSPRTTVVSRPNAAATPQPALAAAGGHPTPDAQRSATRSELVQAHSHAETWSARFKTHWMMKVGMVMAVMGIVLLKFG